MGNKRNRSGHSRKRAVAMAHAEQVSLARLQEEAALAQLELDLATSPEFIHYQWLVARYGPDIVAQAVILATDVAWEDADSTLAQPQAPLPDAPNGDRCGPQGRALVNAMAEYVMTAREAREAGGR
jgi:hypothetical protein